MYERFGYGFGTAKDRRFLETKIATRRFSVRKAPCCYDGSNKYIILKLFF